MRLVCSYLCFCLFISLIILFVHCRWFVHRHSRDWRVDNHPGTGAAARLSRTQHCWRWCRRGNACDYVSTVCASCSCHFTRALTTIVLCHIVCHVIDLLWCCGYMWNTSISKSFQPSSMSRLKFYFTAWIFAWNYF